MNILIVEDGMPFAKAFESILCEAGHQVTCVVGFVGLSPPVGINPDKQPLPLDFAQFDMALCDGQLEGKLQGPQITEVLVASGVNCIGMSTDPKLNAAMCTNGALFGYNKAVMLLAVMSGRVDVASAIETAEQLAGQEATLQPELFADVALRRKAEELIKRFP